MPSAPSEFDRATRRALAQGRRRARDAGARSVEGRFRDITRAPRTPWFVALVVASLVGIVVAICAVVLRCGGAAR